MKMGVLGALSLVGLCFTGACHKAEPVAARTPEPVQVGSRSENVCRVPVLRRGSVRGSAGQWEFTLPGMSPEERKVLTDRLAHLEDALFDFDKSTPN